MHFNIPVFIPHLGCPFQCIYCNQKYISGTIKAPDVDEVHAIIRQKLSTIDSKNAKVEVAFFGGSFTCLSKSEQEKYLQAVQHYIHDKKVNGIRISTRPDYIDQHILDLLHHYHVSTIELGVQSMSDRILKNAGRGHTVEDVIKASALIRKNGFKLGIQTMIGLPGEGKEDTGYTASRVIALQPDCVRIYPVLVLKDTELERLFSAGKYETLPLQHAVERVAMVLRMYINHDINVIKVGLHPSEEFESGGKLVAGPFHPAFREMAMSCLWKNEFHDFFLQQHITAKENKDITITVPSFQYNYAIGYEAENKNHFKKYFNRVRFTRSDVLNRLEFHVDYH
ncbi:MAG TPA: radical SAM protein [Bacteroidales bacterium]|nr:radical SAM protein [Bacteroidales bacterium]